MAHAICLAEEVPAKVLPCHFYVKVQGWQSKGFLCKLKRVHTLLGLYNI